MTTESQTTNEGKIKFIVRDARKEEQLKGADFFILNNELGTRYVEVKTDTLAESTGNVALEIQIVHSDKKTIGCAFKTFPDFLFYWIYPTNTVLYWNPTELIPHIVDWIIEDKYKIVDAENKVSEALSASPLHNVLQHRFAGDLQHGFGAGFGKGSEPFA